MRSHTLYGENLTATSDEQHLCMLNPTVLQIDCWRHEQQQLHVVNHLTLCAGYQCLNDRPTLIIQQMHLQRAYTS